MVTKKLALFTSILSLMFFVSFVSATELVTVDDHFPIVGDDVCEKFEYEFRNVGDSVNVDGIEIEYGGLVSYNRTHPETGELIYTGYHPKWFVNGQEISYEIEGEPNKLNLYLYNGGLISRKMYSLFPIRESQIREPNTHYGEIKGYKISLSEIERGVSQDCIGYQGKNSGGYQDILVHGFQVYSGNWYLISNEFQVPDCDYAPEGQLCQDDVMVSWIWNSISREYIKWLDDNELERLSELNGGGQAFQDAEDELRALYEQKEEELGYDGDYFTFDDLAFLVPFYRSGNSFIKFFLSFGMSQEGMGNTGSYWIYVKNRGNGKYLVNDFVNQPEARMFMEKGYNVLFEGWNFMSVAPWMFMDGDGYYDALSLDDFKGDCEIERAFGWDAREQEWERFGIDEKIGGDGLGLGFIVEVENDCRLALESDDVLPPTLPNGSESCVDSDGGLNYYEAGTVQVMTSENTAVGADDACCEDGVCYAYGDYPQVDEWYCDSSDSRGFSSTLYDCPNGCVDGACVGDGGNYWVNYTYRGDVSDYEYDNSFFNEYEEFGISYLDFQAGYHHSNYWSDVSVYVFENDAFAEDFRENVFEQELVNEEVFVEDFNGLNVYRVTDGLSYIYIWVYENLMIIVDSENDGSDEELFNHYFDKYS